MAKGPPQAGRATQVPNGVYSLFLKQGRPEEDPLGS
jgi:hypothetical protein